MTTMTLELDDDTGSALSRIAQRAGRSEDEVAAEALRAYIDYQNELQASIDAGIAELDAGQRKTTEEMMASLGIDMPK